MGCHRSVTEVSQGYYRSVTAGTSTCAMATMTQRIKRYMAWKGCYRGVTWVSQGCHRSLTGVLQGYYRSVAGMSTCAVASMMKGSSRDMA
jgi:hypothetical protein